MTWTMVPDLVRQTVEGHIGHVTTAHDVPGGQNNDLAAVVHGPTGPVFVKAVRGVGKRMRWLRNEITAGQLAASIAPAALFAADVDDWLIVGFEHAPGRAASLAPGSADLPVVAATVDQLSRLTAPGLRSMRARWEGCTWWEQLADVNPAAVEGWDVPEAERWSARVPALVEGDRLIHADLHGDQFLIGPAGTRVVDWGWPAAGAGWVDAAFLLLRLVEVGHAPEDAESWARGLSCWTVDDAAVTAFAVYVAGLWGYRAATDGGAGWASRAGAARRVAAWALQSAGPPRPSGLRDGSVV